MNRTKQREQRKRKSSLSSFLTPERQQILERDRELLLKAVNCGQELLERLTELRLITKRQRVRLDMKTDPSERIELLLEYVGKFDNAFYEYFCGALQETNNEESANILLGEYAKVVLVENDHRKVEAVPRKLSITAGSPPDIKREGHIKVMTPHGSTDKTQKEINQKRLLQDLDLNDRLLSDLQTRGLLTTGDHALLKTHHNTPETQREKFYNLIQNKNAESYKTFLTCLKDDGQEELHNLLQACHLHSTSPSET